MARRLTLSQIWIAVIAVLIVAGGLGGLHYLIIKQNAMIGAKTIQFISIVFVLPLMLALGVTNGIGRETLGPRIGVVIGFTRGGRGKSRRSPGYILGQDIGRHYRSAVFLYPAHYRMTSEATVRNLF